MIKTLVLFSGGMDSTFVMYKLLSETDDKVTAVLFETADGSTNKISSPKIQNGHVINVVYELKKIRDFDFIVKKVSDDDYEEEVMNHYYTYLVAYSAPFLNDGTYDRVSTGRTWEQYNKKLAYDGRIGNPSAFAAERLFRKLARRGSLWNPLVTHDFCQSFNRWHAFTFLPESLRSKTFSCNSPVITDDKVEPCKECYKCLWDELVLTLIENGMNANQIEEFRKRKCREYGNDVKDAPIRLWIPLFMGRGRILFDLDTKEKVINFVTDPWIGHYSIPKKFHRVQNSIWYMNDLSDIKGIC
jgi:hypothetical protein